VPFAFSAAMRVSEFATAVRRVALLVLSFVRWVRRMGWKDSKAAASGALMEGFGGPGCASGRVGFWVGCAMVARSWCGFGEIDEGERGSFWRGLLSVVLESLASTTSSGK
jgi:hypothetical protein